MTELTKIGNQQMILLALGAVIFTIVPIAVALIWKFRKKEPLSTVLIGAVTFVLFAIVLEKPLQNILIAPTAMGLKDHAASTFINVRPLLWAFIVGLFPGVFEETGRLIAFKTVLKNKKNRETSVSHGIGHGGIEVIFLVGITYIIYLVYAAMINSGDFALLIDQTKSVAPAQADQLYILAGQLSAFSVTDLLTGIVERVFAFLFHTGTSILVFYACRDRKKFWLYPLAVLLHTILDFLSGLYLNGTITVPVWAFEVINGVFGAAVFFGAYLLLYKKDHAERISE
ncbi:MAG: YhfC family intramembrane metalloprotease [Lachnospiraceae bacterium]|nr:YhfC family intramembrane metalloprotease [Lachnospiraceae bacterium]